MQRHDPAPLRWLLRLNVICAVLSGAALLLMMLAGTADVIGTNLDLIGLPSRPVPAVFEFIAAMMVVSTFMALGLAQSRRRHIRVGIITGILPPPAQTCAAMLQHALSAGFFFAIAWFGAKAALHSFLVGEYAPGLVNFPLWPARGFLAAGALLMGVQSLADLINTLLRRGSEPPA